MKVAFICPTHDLKYDNTDYHMALTHLILKYPKYTEFYKQKLANGEYVILDNSLIELGNKALQSDVVMKAAEELRPSEIVLPDVYRDGPATIKSTDIALTKVELWLMMDETKLQVLCHGKDPDEWKRTWDILSKYDDIDVLAVPKVTETQFAGGRPEAVRYALANNPQNKEIHLLGCWSTVDEFKEYSSEEKSLIRGVDTSIVYHCAAAGIKFEDKYDYQKPDWTIDLEEPYKIDEELMLKNQRYMLDILK
jgi:hypothetical protein